jgi:hypothetical protein
VVLMDHDAFFCINSFRFMLQILRLFKRFNPYNDLIVSVLGGCFVIKSMKNETLKNLEIQIIFYIFVTFIDK